MDALEYPTAFASLLGRVLPLQVQVDSHKDLPYRTVAEIDRDSQALREPLLAILGIDLPTAMTDFMVMAESTAAAEISGVARITLSGRTRSAGRCPHWRSLDTLGRDQIGIAANKASRRSGLDYAVLTTACAKSSQLNSSDSAKTLHKRSFICLTAYFYPVRSIRLQMHRPWVS